MNAQMSKIAHAREILSVNKRNDFERLAALSLRLAVCVLLLYFLLEGGVAMAYELLKGKNTAPFYSSFFELLSVSSLGIQAVAILSLPCCLFLLAFHMKITYPNPPPLTKPRQAAIKTHAHAQKKLLQTIIFNIHKIDRAQRLLKWHMSRSKTASHFGRCLYTTTTN
jgi:hypothetical protein